MNAKKIFLFVFAVVFLLVTCLLPACSSRSVMDSVRIENVEMESYRPDGYDGPGGIAGGSDWAGFYIEGTITNTSNKTLNNIVVQVRYFGGISQNALFGKEEEYILEDKIYKLNPNETETFKTKINYEELGVSSILAWAYDWEIYDVVIEK